MTTFTIGFGVLLHFTDYLTSSLNFQHLDTNGNRKSIGRWKTSQVSHELYVAESESDLLGGCIAWDVTHRWMSNKQACVFSGRNRHYCRIQLRHPRARDSWADTRPLFPVCISRIYVVNICVFKWNLHLHLLLRLNAAGLTQCLISILAVTCWPLLGLKFKFRLPIAQSQALLVLCQNFLGYAQYILLAVWMVNVQLNPS